MRGADPRGRFAPSREATEAAPLRVNVLPRQLTRNALAWLGVAVSALLAYLAVRGVQFDAVWATLRESNAWWFVPSIGALVGANVLRAYRWQLLFAHETRPPFGCVLVAMLIGQFFNNVLPARAGEVARVISLNRTSGTSRVETAGTVLIERAYDVLSVLLLLFAMLPWLPPVSWLRAAAVFAIVLVVALLAAAAVIARFGDRPVRILLRPLAGLPFLSLESTNRAAESLVRGLAGIRRPRLALAALLLTTSSWVALGLSAWFVMRGFSFGRGLPPSAAMLVVIAVALAMILPSSPAAVGAFEAATLVALNAYGVGNSDGLSYALALHVVNLLPYLVVGPALLNMHTVGMTRRASVEGPCA
jgi:glycosyltransferase 2 family protein